MNLLIALLFSLLLSACASPPLQPRPEPLLADVLFGPPTEAITADKVFALSDDMKRFVDEEIGYRQHLEDARQRLFDALYGEGRLKLAYDTVMTRSAAEAFAARSGNCLSLVIMTAAFAKELGLPVRFQDVIGEETWSRNGNIYFSNGHVNIALGKRQGDRQILYDEAGMMTIDFLPPKDLRGLHWRAIGEETIIAMYMNNRAAESLAEGRFDAAYAWVRQGIRQDPKFLSAYNTLGVIYRRHGNLAEAERVFEYVLEREPGNTDAMSNLAVALKDQGRIAEANLWLLKLEKIQPYPPFHFFNLGIAAMRGGDFAAARDLFRKEVDRAAYYHEFHFWLGVAYAALGDIGLAREHLAFAMENSTSGKDHDLYAAKLAMITAAERAHRTRGANP